MGLGFISPELHGLIPPRLDKRERPAAKIQWMRMTKSNTNAIAALSLPEMVCKLGLVPTTPATKSKVVCPFHDDHNPSMQVEQHRFKCWACGASGDGAEFLRRYAALGDEQKDRVRALQAGDTATATATAETPPPAPAAVAPFDWLDCVRNADGIVSRIAEWRGVSEAILFALMDDMKFGNVHGKPAFPIEANGTVIGAHVRGDKGWFVTPKGARMNALVLGDLDICNDVYIFESQWDAIIVLDRINWHVDNLPIAVVVTRGAGNGKLVEGLVSEDKRVYLFPQNDAVDAKTGTSPALKWTKAVLSALRRPVFIVPTPAPHKDANDWLRATKDAKELSDAIADAKEVDAFEAWFDRRTKNYWSKNSREEWFEVVETSLKRHLRAAGYSTRVKDGDCLSPLEAKLVELQNCCDVGYAGKLAGYRKGLAESCGNRILITESPRFILPQAGAWPVLGRLIEGMLRHEDVDQRVYLYGWLKTAIEALHSGEIRPGQILVLAGPPACGKSLLQNLITILLGGRVAKPFRYMCGQTPFNADLFEAEHLAVEDEASSTNLTARRNFGTRVKEFTVNEVQSCHGKNKQAVMLRPFWRVSITLNDEPENLMILPPLDESVLDKFILMKAALRPMSMPTQSLAQRRLFWQALLAELPAFVHYLLHEFQVPVELQSERFGCVHYHHPELLSAIAELSPESQLLSMIDGWFEQNCDRLELRGSAQEIEFELKTHFGSDAGKLLSWPTACGVYLGRLQQKHPERFRFHRTAESRVWQVVRRGEKPRGTWPPV
jgi:energy-coupling factor transporter ATP-binding protein EcfA2